MTYHDQKQEGIEARQRQKEQGAVNIDMAGEDRMPCENCGKNEASNCGYGVFTCTETGVTYDRHTYGTEFDCEFSWPEDIEMECVDCPLIWCKDCRDDLLVAAVILVNKHRRR